jgi:hypothetical protein
MSKIEVGELIYEATLQITGMTEYGVSFEALMAGRVPPPPEGSRFDVAFEGIAKGPKMNSKIKGVDYLWIRADGRTELDVHAEASTDDGQKISLKATGVSLPRKDSGISDLRENVTLFSSFKDYTWVNALQVWAIGTVDLAKGIISVSGYSA